MQSIEELNLNIKEGAPASAIPRKWVMYVNNVLKFLEIRGGKLFIYKDKWTIEVKNNAIWSGRVFFGGELISITGISIENGITNFSDWKKTHVKVNLKTGEVTGEDWDEQDTADLAEYEYYSVMTKTQDANGNDIYTPNNHTVGDIHVRIT